MATNLIAQLMSRFDASAIDSVAAALGESPARTQSALGGAVPALLAGIAHSVTTPAQAEMLLGMITRHRFEGGWNGVASPLTVPGGISSLIATGRPLLESLLRGRTSSVGDWVTGLSGIGKSSSLSLMSLVLPLLLGQIGRRVTDMGWSASSLLGLLAEQRFFLQSAPAGLQPSPPWRSPTRPGPQGPPQRRPRFRNDITQARGGPGGSDQPSIAPSPPARATSPGKEASPERAPAHPRWRIPRCGSSIRRAR